MARFTFTQGFGDTPSEDSYNQIVSDFNSLLSGGQLDKDNLANEAIRFRHVISPTTRVVLKDCSERIWLADRTFLGDVGRTVFCAGTGSSADAELFKINSSGGSCVLEYDAPGTLQDGVLLEYSLWYFPYSIHSHSKVSPAIRLKSTGAWIDLIDHRRNAGIAVGFYTRAEQTPYDNQPDFPPEHPFLNAAPAGYRKTDNDRLDRLGTIAYGGPVICTVTADKNGFTVGSSTYPLTDIDRFGMFVGHYIGDDVRYVTDPGYADHLTEATIFGRVGRHESRCSMYDRLFLKLVTRGH